MRAYLLIKVVRTSIFRILNVYFEVEGREGVQGNPEMDERQRNQAE